MRIRKKETSVGLIGKVLNILNNSKQDAYSCDYINNLTIYSEEEVKTNKTWIDGKPIYRKVLTGTLPNGSGENTFIFNNIEIINFYGKIKSTAGTSFLINTYYMPLPAYSISGWIDSDKNLKIECGGNYNTSSEYEIIIEYTKTTDPVG